MDRCHRHPEETRPTSRDSQGVNKVKIWMNTFLSGFLMFSPHIGQNPGSSQCTMESATT